jgi:hypothetical protein
MSLVEEEEGLSMSLTSGSHEQVSQQPHQEGRKECRSIH